MDTKNGKKRKSDNNNNNIERAAADRMHSKKRKKKIAVDRLSKLPNDLIHKIFSFISIKDSVKTIALSSRYRFIWTTMPYLNFSTEDFPKLPKFSKFVTHFLTHRNSRIDVYSLNLCFRGKLTQPSVKKLMDYAFSHNIQRLDVKCLLEENEIEFPLSLPGSGPSLKHLSLKQGLETLRSNQILKTRRRSVNRHGISRSNLKVTSNLMLPALTTLYLQYVTFCSDDSCVGLLSKCANLKNLTLERFDIDGLSNNFSICHPGLYNLTLDTVGLYSVEVINVVAPQLKNLTIRCGDSDSELEHVVSAPNLASFAYRGYHLLNLSTSDGFHCLKKADIWVMYPDVDDAHQMVCLLQQLHNVNFLTLSLEIIELLSSSVELISHQPSPFVNLKSLTIYPEKLSEWETWHLPKGKVNLSTEVKNYLLDSSPGATLTMFSREDIKAIKDAASAQKLMTKLRVLLEKEKANTKSKGKATMESDNAKMHKKRKAQPELKLQVQIGENVPLIKDCWKDLSVQFKRRKTKACHIISMLESIEGLLKKLPVTKRAMIQPSFSSLCAEIDTVMSNITDCMKMQFDKNQSQLSVFFHEVATSTTMELSS